MYFDEWEVEHGEKDSERYRLSKEAGEVTKKRLDKIVIKRFGLY